MTAPSTKPRAWEALVASHRAAFAEIVELATACPYRPADPATVRAASLTLTSLADKAQRWSQALDRECRDPYLSDSPHAFTSIGFWGPKGRGPAIEHMLRSARHHAAAALGARSELKGIAA